jgi:hypothetical protein
MHRNHASFVYICRNRTIVRYTDRYILELHRCIDVSLDEPTLPAQFNSQNLCYLCIFVIGMQ